VHIKNEIVSKREHQKEEKHGRGAILCLVIAAWIAADRSLATQV